MRLLVLAKSFPTGTQPAYGADLMSRYIVEHLAGSGHQVTVLTCRQMTPLASGSLSVWPRLVRDRPDPRLQPDQWSARHKLQFLAKARHNYVATRRALREFTPQVVYVSDVELLTGSPLAAVVDAQVPLVFHAHDLNLAQAVGGGSAGEKSRGVKGALLDWFLPSPRDPRRITSAPLLAVSGYIAAHYRALGWEAEQVRIVYNGIDDRHLDGGPRTRPAANSVLLAGRCVPEKGLRVAVEALGLLARRGVESELHLVGEFRDAAYRVQLERLALDRGVAERVIYRGYVSPEAMPQEYRRHASAIMPSIWEEPFGLISAEAQANGTPVVVTRTGGLPETLREGETGLVVPPGDAAALADALERLLTDADLWQRMSLAAQAWTRTQFARGRMVRAVEATLLEAAGGKTRTA